MYEIYYYISRIIFVVMLVHAFVSEMAWKEFPSLLITLLAGLFFPFIAELFIVMLLFATIMNKGNR